MRNLQHGQEAGADEGDGPARIASLQELRRVGGCKPPDPESGDSGWSFDDTGFWYGDTGSSGGDTGSSAEPPSADPSAIYWCEGPNGDIDKDGVPNAVDPNCVCGDPNRDDDADGIANIADPTCICRNRLDPTGDADGDGSPNSVDNDCDGDGVLETFDRGATAADPPGQPCVGRDPLDQAQGGCGAGSTLLAGLIVFGYVRPRRHRRGGR